eukprot:Lankesteria_metandrocarpae@DN2245_c0_g1_i1.p1
MAVPAEEAYGVFRDRDVPVLDSGTTGALDALQFKRQTSRPEYTLEYTPGLSSKLSVLDTSPDAVIGGRHTPMEMPAERLRRLQAELQEVKEFVEACEQGTNPAATAALRLAEGELHAGPAKLLQELNVLQEQLSGVLQNDDFVEDANYRPTSVDGILTANHEPSFDLVKSHLDTAFDDLNRNLAAYSESKTSEQKAINTLTASGGTLSPRKGGQVEAQSPFTYELYCVPSLQPPVDAAALLKLEHRVSELEQFLGLKAWSDVGYPFSDLNSGLLAIAQRIYLLDPYRLESVGRKVQKLTLEMDTMLRKKEKLLDMPPVSPLEDRHIVDIYDMCEKWRRASAVLPVVVRRLKVLKSLHQEAAAVSSRVNALETQQLELSRLLDQTAANFETLQSTMSDNLAWVRLSVNDLQDTVSQLQP